VWLAEMAAYRQAVSRVVWGVTYSLRKLQNMRTNNLSASAKRTRGWRKWQHIGKRCLVLFGVLLIPLLMFGQPQTPPLAPPVQAAPSVQATTRKVDVEVNYGSIQSPQFGETYDITKAWEIQQYVGNQWQKVIGDSRGNTSTKPANYVANLELGAQYRFVATSTKSVGWPGVGECRPRCASGGWFHLTVNSSPILSYVPVNAQEVIREFTIPGNDVACASGYVPPKKVRMQRLDQVFLPYRDKDRLLKAATIDFKDSSEGNYRTFSTNNAKISGYAASGYSLNIAATTAYLVGSTSSDAQRVFVYIDGDEQVYGQVDDNDAVKLPGKTDAVAIATGRIFPGEEREAAVAAYVDHSNDKEITLSLITKEDTKGRFLSQRFSIQASGAGVKVAIGDVNGDGRYDDIIVVWEGSNDYQVGWFTWNAEKSSLVNKKVYAVAYNGSRKYDYGLAVGDFMGLGADQVALVTSGDNKLHIHLLQGKTDYSLEEAVTYNDSSSKTQRVAAKAADVDGDLYSDLVIANAYTNDSKLLVRVYAFDGINHTADTANFVNVQQGVTYQDNNEANVTPQFDQTSVTHISLGVGSLNADTLADIVVGYKVGESELRLGTLKYEKPAGKTYAKVTKVTSNILADKLTNGNAAGEAVTVEQLAVGDMFGSSTFATLDTNKGCTQMHETKISMVLFAPPTWRNADGSILEGIYDGDDNDGEFGISYSETQDQSTTRGKSFQTEFDRTFTVGYQYQDPITASGGSVRAEFGVHGSVGKSKENTESVSGGTTLQAINDGAVFYKPRTSECYRYTFDGTSLSSSGKTSEPFVHCRIAGYEPATASEFSDWYATSFQTSNRDWIDVRHALRPFFGNAGMDRDPDVSQFPTDGPYSDSNLPSNIDNLVASEKKLLWRWDAGRTTLGSTPPFGFYQDVFPSASAGIPAHVGQIPHIVEVVNSKEQSTAWETSVGFHAGISAEVYAGGVVVGGSASFSSSWGKSVSHSFGRGMGITFQSPKLKNGDYVSAGCNYTYTPYFYSTKIRSPVTGTEHPVMVLDYFVPERGSGCKPLGTALASSMPTTLASGLPAAPIITSASHPDLTVWGTTGTAKFAWTQPITDVYDPAYFTYRYIVDGEPTTVPSDTLLAGWTEEQTLAVTQQNDGLWFLHVQPQTIDGRYGTTAHYPFLVDATPPAIEIALDSVAPKGSNGWYVSPISATVTVDDEYGSGVVALDYSLDDGKTWNNYLPYLYATPLVLNQETNERTFLVRATDTAGHQTVATTTYKLDKTAPTSAKTRMEVVKTAAGYNQLVVEGTYADTHAGPNTMVLTLKHNDNDYYTLYPTETAAGTWVYDGINEVPSGRYTVYGHAVDQAGNVEAETAYGPIELLPQGEPQLQGSSITVQPTTVRPGDKVTVTVQMDNTGQQEINAAPSVILPQEITVENADPALAFSTKGETDAVLAGTVTRNETTLWMGERSRLIFQGIVAPQAKAGALPIRLLINGTWVGIPDKLFTGTAAVTVTVDPTLAQPENLLWAEFAVDNADVVQSRAINLSIFASETAKSVQVQEWFWNAQANQWMVKSSSGWLPYTSKIPYTLSAGDGVKYLTVQVASEDNGKGKQSRIERDSLMEVTLVGNRQQLKDGERNVYHVPVQASEIVTLTLTTYSGDADLYGWGPREGFTPTLVSETTKAVEQVRWQARYNGTLRVEVLGRGKTSYRLTVEKTMGTETLINAYVPAGTKSRPTSPLVVANPLNQVTTAWEPGTLPPVSQECFNVVSVASAEESAPKAAPGLALRNSAHEAPLTNEQGTLSSDTTNEFLAEYVTSRYPQQMRESVGERMRLHELLALQADQRETALAAAATLQADEVNVHGRVLLPNGQPAASALVYRYTLDEGGFRDPSTIAITNDDGTFSFANVITGTYSMDVVPSDTNGTLTLLDARFTVTAPKISKDLGDYHLEAAPKHITGTVTRDGTTPLAGAIVGAYNDKGWQYVSDVTNSDGTFDLGVGGGNWLVFVNLQNDADWVFVGKGQTVSFVNDSTTKSQQVSLSVATAGGYVTGRVVLPNGNPLVPPANAKGTLNRYAKFNLFDIATDTEISLFIKSDGTFRLPAMFGTYHAWVWLNSRTYPDYLNPSIDPVTVVSGTVTLDDVQLLAKNATITGNVTDEYGNAVKDLYVDAWDENGVWIYGITDEQGAYTIQAREGTWDVRPYVASTSPYLFRGATQLLSLAANETATMNYQLLQATKTITGTVVDQVGKVLPNVKAWAYARYANETKPFQVVSVQNGKFRMNSLDGDVRVGLFLAPGSTYSFLNEATPASRIQSLLGTSPFAQAPLLQQEMAQQEQSLAAIVAQNGEVQLVLKANDATIRGQLQDANGKPITGVDGYVFVAPSKTSTTWQWSYIQAQDGTYRLPVADGTWYVSYHLNTDAYVSSPTAALEVTVAQGQTKEQPITLMALDDMMSGQVVDQDNNPMASVFVWVRMANLDFRVRTDQSGQFTVRFPSSASLQQAQDCRYYASPRSCQVDYAGNSTEIRDCIYSIPAACRSAMMASHLASTAAVSDVVLVVRRVNSFLVGQVFDANNQPLEQAFVAAYSNDNQSATGYSDSRGCFKLPTARDSRKETLWYVDARQEQRDSGSAGGLVLFGQTDTITVSDVTTSTSTLGVALTAENNVVSSNSLGIEPKGYLPAAERSTFKVAEGGNFTLADGTQIQIPPMSVPTSASEVQIVIEPTMYLPNTMYYTVHKYGYAITFYDTSGQQIVGSLTVPAQIVFRYAENGVDETKLLPALLINGNEWQVAQGFTADTSANKITVQTLNLGSWALVTENALMALGTPTQTTLARVYLPIVQR